MMFHRINQSLYHENELHIVCFLINEFLIKHMYISTKDAYVFNTKPLSRIIVNIFQQYTTNFKAQ